MVLKKILLSTLTLRNSRNGNSKTDQYVSIEETTQSLGVNLSVAVAHFSFICWGAGDVWEMSKDKESRLKTKLILSQMVAFSLLGNLINGQSQTRVNLN